MKAKSANRYPPELRERAVRMLLEHRGEYDSEPDAIRAISSKISCRYDSLRVWLRQHKIDVHGDVGDTTDPMLHYFSALRSGWSVVF